MLSSVALLSSQYPQQPPLQTQPQLPPPPLTPTSLAIMKTPSVATITPSLPLQQQPPPPLLVNNGSNTKTSFEIDWTIELQTYIRIDTSHPNVNYNKAIEYLIDVVTRMNCGLFYRIYIHNKYPLLIVTRPGKLNRGILLTTHMDVVNAPNITEWDYPPFSGYYDLKTDRIYGRGTQSMKTQAIQYLAALHHLKNAHLEYTLHVAFVPNEEIGGISGLADFVKTPQFRSLNIEFAIDEGCVSPFQHFLLFYAERTLWQFMIRIRSEMGHAALPSTLTCEAKLRRLLNEIEHFRQRDLEINITKRREPKIGYATTINMTRVQGGQLLNVMPREIHAYFDMRIGIETNLNTIYDEIQRWTLAANSRKLATADNSVTLEWIEQRTTKSPQTDINHKLCAKLLKFFQEENIPYALTVAPHSSSATFLRQENIPVLGFTPINMTPHLVYKNNEYIYKKQFLHNITLVTNLIKYLATN